MPQLVFHSVNPDYAPDSVSNLIRSLQKDGFLGRRWLSGEMVIGHRHLIGKTFLSQITFMGCAPAIELEPTTSDANSTEFCHIEISEVTKETHFIKGCDHIISRCPLCRQRHAQWNILPQDLIYACDKCNEKSHLIDYDWKNTAGCGRFFIRVHGIYPQEALPTSSFLQKLEKLSNTKWNYFYIQ